MQFKGHRLLLQCFSSKYISTSQISGAKPRVAIIGSGPAGFYTAHQLLKRHSEVCVDIYESLPVPFGLVRFGVAPDHPEVKNVINQFTTLAQSERCRFLGNVHIGRDVMLSQLKPHYTAVVLAYGAEDDKPLRIPGEDLRGVYSARAFVGWYNGLPLHANLNPDLSGETAVIIGHGNVALDVARILLTPLDLLKKTDICSHAVQSLAQSNIKKVVLVGRRGPLQVAFTIKELREMIRLPCCRTILHPQDFEPYKDTLGDLPRPRKRITELLIKTANDISTLETEKSLELKFLRSPVECLPADNGTVQAIKLEINKLENTGNFLKAVGCGEYEEISCSMVLRSIGYKSLSIDLAIPFDNQLGIIPNRQGRVLDDNGAVVNGLYCSGWVKRGPVGVILNTMNDSFETAEVIAQDITEGMISAEHCQDDVALNKLFNDQGIQPVSFTDWEKINQEEQRRGIEKGKPREKIVSIKEMLHIIK